MGGPKEKWEAPQKIFRAGNGPPHFQFASYAPDVMRKTLRYGALTHATVLAESIGIVVRLAGLRGVGLYMVYITTKRPTDTAHSRHSFCHRTCECATEITDMYDRDPAQCACQQNGALLGISQLSARSPTHNTRHAPPPTACTFNQYIQ